MPTENKCPHCGKPVSPDALMGLCPDCMLKAGVGSGASSVPGGASAAPSVPPTPAELARYFPQLEILELLGRGGMGAVYKARQKQLDRLVALKILPPSVSHDPAFADRFAREAKALAKLNHPSIVTLYEFGQVSGTGVPPVSGVGQASSLSAPSNQPAGETPAPLYFFLMEFVDGVNLRQLLNAGRIAPREALAIVPQICDALQYAHDHGIVHRDIKPENILLDRAGRVKVADFGLAKLVGGSGTGVSPVGHEQTAAIAGETPAPLSSATTEAGQVLGTPQYMAPEQVKHPQEVDHRADIYSLGVVFYQMLTGELPGNPIAPPSSRTRGIQIDVRLDEVVLRALEQKPELRYQQVSEVRTMVETIAGDTGVPPAEPDVATGFFRPEAKEFGRDMAVMLTKKGLTKRSLLWFADQGLLLFDFTGQPFGKGAGFGKGSWRGVNWWLLLVLGCTTMAFLINGEILAIELVQRLWHGTSPHGKVFALSSSDKNMLLWMVVGGIGRLAALNLVRNEAARAGGAQADKAITVRRVFVVFRWLMLLAALGVLGGLYGSWLVGLSDTAQMNVARGGQWFGIFIAVGLFMAIVVGYIRLLSRADTKTNAAPLSALEFWMAMNRGNYAQSWETTAPMFQRTISKEEWVNQMEKVRRPLGKALSCKARSVKFTPDLTLMDAVYDTSFDSQLSAVESVTLAMQPNGEYKVISYLIRPA